MAKRKKLKAKKFLGFVYLGISAVLVCTLYSSAMRVIHQKRELVVLKETKKELEAKKKALALEVQLLEDDDYVARYARDNYIFSTEGEEVVKLPESKK